MSLRHPRAIRAPGVTDAQVRFSIRETWLECGRSSTFEDRERCLAEDYREVYDALRDRGAEGRSLLYRTLNPYHPRPTTREGRAARSEERFRDRVVRNVSIVDARDLLPNLPPSSARKVRLFRALLAADLAGTIGALGAGLALPAFGIQAAILALSLGACALGAWSAARGVPEEETPIRLVPVLRPG